MEAVYLKELRSYSISEVMNFRDKHVELVNRLAQSDNGESEADTAQKRKIARLSTKEKVAQYRANMKQKNRSKKKKCKSAHKETPPVLPLVVSKESSKNASEKPERDLIPGKDVVFVFKVYPPYAYDPHNRGSKVNHNMEIAILGHQTLNLLCDKIICDDMLMEVGGDISENPDTPVRQRLGEKYKSRMLYIGNNFYVDKSHGNIDYSSTIRPWGNRNGIYFGETLDMHHTACLDLVARIGYPYVFQHLGACEHILRIEYARLIDERDCLESKLYPFYNYVSRSNNLRACMACMELSQWIVMDSPRMIANPSFLCNSCFRSYHYVDGKKVGNFSAVRYWDCTIFGNELDALKDENNDGNPSDDGEPKDTE